ncbi:CRISPR-associated protein Cas3 [Paenibacillus stellifer]|uniref:CRISPR-associated protein Cas3 n=1 Tax=Paenibacillus stellifer TaxID=169760 RepID=A0A089LRU2_9BACL|nr:CRISPR-associated helicase/endonuclease Cas3 [Paenibacillus stellifer]AIQ62815.1 CRISPR-associated protein Cas3 [Paenibacillus stellifer]
MDYSESDDYTAHIRESDKQVQTVKDHLLEVRDLARAYGDPLGIGHIAGLAGLLHDSGKYADKFRDYLVAAVNNPDAPPRRGSVDHSTAGGKLLFDLLHNPSADSAGREDHVLKMVLAEVVGNAIISHHSYLQDFLNPESESNYLQRVRDKPPEEIEFDQVKVRFFKWVISVADFQQYVNQAASELKTYLDKDMSVTYEQKLMYLTKLIFSMLIDADRTNTRCYEQGYPDEAVDEQKLFKQYRRRLHAHIESLGKGNHASSPVNRLRREMSDQCEQFALKPSGIYTLSIPTGGGKTLASLRYALAHAELAGKKRIIYVVPYTTIIEQNAEEVRRILKDNVNILEHHSNVADEGSNETDEQEDGLMNMRQKLKLARDNWDSPIIFTTMVQFLNVFYADGSRNIRRLHRLSESVLIFDEVQKVPVHCVSLFNQAVNFLRTYAKSSIVLCTATQPELDYVKHKLNIEAEAEMIANLEHVIEAFKRVEIIDYATEEQFDTNRLAAFVMSRVQEISSVLVILNTKTVVNRLYRQLIDYHLPASVYHLSTSMCPAHRKSILSEVKDRLDNKSPVICISTQLIEAGVDVSFACVIRSMAGLDSIAQAAGRCNRHGEDKIRCMYVIDHEEENLKHLPEIRKGKEITRKILIDMKGDARAHGGNLLSVAAMEKYFREFYTEFESRLNYPVPGLNKDMTALLHAARKDNGYLQYYQAQYGKPLPLFLANCYKTAAENFHVIDDHTNPVIVPYEEGQDIIAELNGQSSIGDLTSLLRKAQHYTINVYKHELEELSRNNGLVSFLDGKVLVLKEGAYNGEYGLNLENDSSLDLYLY